MTLQTKKVKGLYILAETAFSLIYGPEEQRDISELADIYAPPQTRESIAAHPEILAEAEVILSGWGAPVLDSTLLQSAPNLKAFLYGAGATSGLLPPSAWERGILVTSASSANAVPVAEFTLAAIIFALKRVLPTYRQIQTTGDRIFTSGEVPGAYGSTIGIVSLGVIGRLVSEKLRAALPDTNILAYDPFVSSEEALRLEVSLVGLEALFRRSDVVSLHTPWLPETEGLIRGHHISTMKQGATLINTSRGAIIAQDEMLDVLMERHDLTAVLDVTHPEPPPAGSRLFELKNVFLTPHISGSQDRECRRMGRYMVEELQRYCQGESFKWAVRPETSFHTAHRSPGSLPSYSINDKQSFN